jgi:hypothetical protein
MALAIVVLPAPDVPTTTMRIFAFAKSACPPA